jgi:hypothetical protein
VKSLVELASGFYDDSQGALWPTTAEQQAEQWRKLNAAARDWLQKYRRQDQRSALAYHATEARVCELGQQWFAAAFHLRFLINDDPTDPELRRRRARAYHEQGLSDKAQADDAAAAALAR